MKAASKKVSTFYHPLLRKHIFELTQKSEKGTPSWSSAARVTSMQSFT